MNKQELATLIEQKWMEYNAAVVSRLHTKQAKEALGNLMINNVNDIIQALKNAPETPAETNEVLTSDKSDPTPKKVKK